VTIAASLKTTSKPKLDSDSTTGGKFGFRSEHNKSKDKNLVKVKLQLRKKSSRMLA